MKTDLRCLTLFRRKRPSLLASPADECAPSPTVCGEPEPQAFKDKDKDRDTPPPFVAFARTGHAYACACGHITAGSGRGSPRPSSPDLPPYIHQEIKTDTDTDTDTDTATDTDSEIEPGNMHDARIAPEMRNIIDSTIIALDPDLRQLSLDIWEHPEVGFDEHYAHDRLTALMEAHGFTVTRAYLGLATAWRAEYRAPGTRGGRVVGVQAEMDALPHIGHACGHNLIAAAGVAVALALKAALARRAAGGAVVLLGTPAEEHGGGKILLLERGAYRDMDVCIMAHPGPGAPNGTSVQPWIAMQAIEVEFFGHSAHAAYAPWEAQNALDAAFLAYSGIAVLRQQLRPTYRVHGIVTGRDWEPNVIPDYSKMRWVVRAPTWPELEGLRKKIVACFEGAALATACEVKITPAVGYKDCQQNAALGDEYVRLARAHYGMDAVVTTELVEASTDFGDISYALPSLQPVFAIPVQKNGSNHTPQFAESARTPAAHDATLATAKALALTALRVVEDDAFFREIQRSFEEQQARL